MRAADSSEYESVLHDVMGLRISVFQDSDPARCAELLPQLVEAEARLQTLQPSTAEQTSDPRDQQPAFRGQLLGASTTQLQVDVEICMNPLPTAIYPLLNPEVEPLVKVTLRNLSHDPRRVRVRAAIEGLSAEAVRSVELPRKTVDGSEVTLGLLPTFLPGRAAAMTEVQRATISILSEDLDNKIEAHNTYSIVCLARGSSFNAVRNPNTKKLIDFSHYYGAWVTPYDELVQERIRHAAGLCVPPQIWGYQGTKDDVRRQVEALFQSLQDHKMTYVNSVTDYGAPEGYCTQRTRFPRESLEQHSANCIDGTVLMASMLEGSSLNSAIVLVPGHAFIGWETWKSSDQWEFLETTMMGQGQFDAACKSAQNLFQTYSGKSPNVVRMHKLKELRRRGIWPMV